jgi:hypothetical protein
MSHLGHSLRSNCTDSSHTSRAFNSAVNLTSICQNVSISKFPSRSLIIIASRPNSLNSLWHPLDGSHSRVRRCGDEYFVGLAGNRNTILGSSNPRPAHCTGWNMTFKLSEKPLNLSYDPEIYRITNSLISLNILRAVRFLSLHSCNYKLMHYTN